jgi:HNH endonuclease
MKTGSIEAPKSKFDDGRSMQEHLAERMMSGLKTLPNGCWVSSKSYLHVNGYAFVVIDRRPGKGLFRERVHRLSWKHFKGPIPDGMKVCHKCDYRPCFNPDHLFLGTQKENLADMSRKGRRRGVTAKLKERDVTTILKAYDAGVLQRDLGKKYGVSQTAISMIVLGKRWRYIYEQHVARDHVWIIEKYFDIEAYLQFKNTQLRAEPSSGTSTTAINLDTNGTSSVTNNVALGTGHVKAIVDTMKERNIQAMSVLAA